MLRNHIKPSFFLSLSIFQANAVDDDDDDASGGDGGRHSRRK